MKTVRWSSLIPVVVVFALAGPGHAQTKDSRSVAPPAPHLKFVFEEFVTLGASIHPGPTPFGERNIVPITGGTFSGPNIRGKILPGAWDWQLVTKTGCHTVDANYMIQTDDGAIINVVNKGMLCEQPGRHSPFYTTPTFEAPLGPHDWLNSGAYVGTLEGTTLHGVPAVHIRFYRAE